MSGGFRQSQATLHTWSGLLVGWVLYAMFLTGTASYWREEITRWATPEVAASTDAAAVQAAQAIEFLRQRAGAVQGWTIGLPGERQAGIQVSWQHDGGRAKPADRAVLSRGGEPVEGRDSKGGDFFYRLHFDLHYVPRLWGRWIAGFCAMFMLVAIVSGVITHKKIFADFFTFRRGKGQRSWLDGHNALAVLSLPFHLMITYTGLITLMTLYMPFGATANYASRDAMNAELFPRPPELAASGVAAPLAAIGPLVRRAEQDWGGGAIESIRIAHPGDRNARVLITRATSGRIVDGGAIEFDGVSGDTTWRTPSPNAASDTRGAMIGLHTARFAPLTMRWLYFLSSLAGTLMVASGLVLWTVKRRARLADPQRPHFGFRLVETLNIAFIAGLPMAMAGYLWANRLLPLGLESRADWEIHSFFLVWAGCLLWSGLRRPRRAWVELLAAAAVLSAGLPIFNIALTRHGLFDSLAAGDAALAGMDLGLSAIAIALALTARAVHRHAPARAPARDRARRAVAPSSTPAAGPAT
ncbi:PepSY-associated TM helix domain-containing protein [Lysobacter sp. CA199]|uniref:PepSY-associated TM helix domain-containing protein n=1 Tax=Lysobacter sp. CA199 TaxID=3455608 RepID=UPI003F8D6C90